MNKPDIDVAVIPEDVLERATRACLKPVENAILSDDELWQLIPSDQRAKMCSMVNRVLLAADYPALCERVATLEDERAELQETRKALATVGEERRQFRAERDALAAQNVVMREAVEAECADCELSIGCSGKDGCHVRQALSATPTHAEQTWQVMRDVAEAAEDAVSLTPSDGGFGKAMMRLRQAVGHYASIKKDGGEK